MGKVKIDLTVEERQALSAIGKLVGQFDQLEEGATSASKEINQSFKETSKSLNLASASAASFVGNLASSASIASVKAIGSAIGSLVSTAVGFTSVASVQEDAVNKLNTQLALSGEFTKKTSKDLQNFASELQSTTKFGDEAILGQIAFSQAMGASSEQAKEILKAAADMSASLGTDLNSSVRNISKTLGGYAGELGEVIPELKNLTTEQLKAGEGIALLSAQFSGAASADVLTFSGALQQLSNTSGDTQEILGSFITKNPLVVAGFQGVSKALEQLGVFFENNREAITEFINNGINLAIDSISNMGAAFAGLIQGGANVLSFFDFLSDGFLAFQSALTELARVAFVTQKVLTDLAGGDSSAAQNNIDATNATLKGIEEERDALQMAVFERERNAEKIANTIRELSEKSEKIIKKEVNSVIAEDGKKTQTVLENINKVAQAKTEASQVDKGAVEAQAKLQSEILALEANTELVRQERELIKKQNKELLTEEELLQLQEIEAQKNDIRFLAEEERILKIQDARTRELELEKLHAGETFKIAQKRTKDEVALAKRREAEEKNSLSSLFSFEQNAGKNRAANMKSTLGTISTLQSSGNSELFAIGKAAAISTATIDGIAGVQKAWALGPILGPALSVLVAAASAINIAKIASAKPPGMAMGGIVSGPTNLAGVDNTFANLASGEMVLNRGQQQNLFNSINSGGGNNRGVESALDRLTNAILGQAVVLQVDGRELAKTIRNEIQDGFALT